MKSIVPQQNIFTFEGHNLQVIIHNDKPAIISNELCAALGYKNPRRALSKIPDHQRGVTIRDTLGGPQETNIVYEGGWYRLAFGSHLPNAEAFTDLVTDVILPSIRKTGKYEIPPLGEGIAKWPASMNKYLAMTEEQKLNALDKLAEELRNLAYSVQPRELHLHLKTLCVHAFGILNNWNAPLESSDTLLVELLTMRLKLQEEHTQCFNYPEIERKIQTFIREHMYPIVHRMK